MNVYQIILNHNGLVLSGKNIFSKKINYIYKSNLSFGDFTLSKRNYHWVKTNYIDNIFVTIVDTTKYEKYKELATIDALTGIYNRRGLISTTKHLFSITMRNNLNLGVMFIDLDNLKKLNTLSYESGDSAIKIVAEILSNNMRKSDILARYGGDEFVVVMGMKNSLDYLKNISKRIHSELSKNTNNLITVSIGAVLIKNNKQIDNLSDYWPKIINLADELVKQAKKDGKNRSKFKVLNPI